MVDCFKDFIKYNTYLVHLDLTMTGLIEPAIKFIVALLRKSQALSCLHLCGNKGIMKSGKINKELKKWVKARIKAKKLKPPMHIPPCKPEPEQKSALTALL